MGKIVQGFFVVFLLGAGPFFFGACGLEDHAYLSPVAESNITIRDNSQVIIRLPSRDTVEAQYFTHFAIFYRIYISDILQVGQITPEVMRDINANLSYDYNGIFPYTSNYNSDETTTNNAVGSIFSSRRYYEMELDGTDIITVLDGDAQGETLIIKFPSDTGQPFLTLGGGQPYVLYRSTGRGTFDPKPDRYFVNHPDLANSANLTDGINSDIAGPSPGGASHAYASMYIAKAGRELQSLALIYSTPTFLGVLKLPDE